MSEHSEACNICGGTSFGPGPRGRMAANGMKPFCTKCESLERQRAIHGYFGNLAPETLGWRKAIHFSSDRSLDTSWFHAYEVSRFGGQNSLDLQAIDRPSASYDFVLANHVLEKVADDIQAFRELVRILAPRGVLSLNISALAERNKTELHAAGGNKWGNHRTYGRDVITRLPIFELNVSFCAVGVADPVTGTADRVLLFARSPAALEPMADGARDQGLSWMVW